MASYPTPPSLFNIVSDVREFILAGARAFPTAFAATALFVGLFTANYAMLFFLIGLLILTPTLNAFLNWAFGSIFGAIYGETVPTWAMGNSTAICNVVLGDSDFSKSVSRQVISSWWALTVFIIGYLMTNALALYKLPVQYPANASTDVQAQTDEKAMLRKSRAITALVVIAIAALILFAFRFASSCDSVFGLLVGALAFGSLSAGWFHTLSAVGQDRLSDLFGVANRLLSPFALANEPVACLPDTHTPPN
jgi:hypothetical protein